MMQEWDEWGARVPLTVLWIDDCQVCLSKIQTPILAQLCARKLPFNLLSVQVVQVKTPEREGYLSLQLGCGSKREKQLNGR